MMNSAGPSIDFCRQNFAPAVPGIVRHFFSRQRISKHAIQGTHLRSTKPIHRNQLKSKELQTKPIFLQ